MSTRSPSERIRDILEAIQEIQQFTDGLTLDQFQADRKTLKAVMANFAIMGEASGHLPEMLINLLSASSVSAWWSQPRSRRRSFSYREAWLRIEGLSETTPA